MSVQSPPVTDADRDLAGRLQSDPHLVSGMRRCRELIGGPPLDPPLRQPRDTAEALAARYHIWDEDFKVGVHHGSLSKEVRIEMEEDFKAERLKGLICTSSLELGIDIGSVDYATNTTPSAGVPPDTADGTGRTLGGERTEGSIVTSNPDEIAESLVIARRAMNGELERLRVRERPLSVLANQMVAMAMVGQIGKEQAYQVIRRSYPFRNLSREEYQAVMDQLLRIGLLFDNDERYRRSNRGMRYFYDNLSMIPDERTFLVRDISSRRVIGTLDESFVVSFAEPYAAFITHGKTWRIVEVKEEELLVEQIRDIGSIPSWVGEDLPVPFEVAQEVGKLRRTHSFGEYTGDADALEALQDYLRRQEGDGAVPSDEVVTLEMGKRIAVLNLCFGTRVNETISKVLSVLLSARLGESVGVHTDPYRIVIELPRDIDPKIIIETLLSIRSERVESLVRLVLKSSSYLRFRFVFVAKKFGAIERDADYRQVNFTRLAEAYEDTVLFEEAVRKVLWEDFDVEGTVSAMKRIESGQVTFRTMGLTTMGRAGLQQSRELIMPQRADHTILMALKRRLEAETMSMSCLNCRAQWRMRPQAAPDRISCPGAEARW